MESITHTPPLVNGAKFEKWNAKKGMAVQMSEKLQALGLDKRALRMRDCSRDIGITYCPKCGKYEITQAKLCRDRLCPVCSWRLSVKRYAEMLLITQNLLTAYPECKWSFLTLTVKNCESKLLGETLKKMAAAWNRMCQRKIIKEEVKGWARATEVTFNAEASTLHPHFHVLVMWENDADIKTSGTLLLHQWIESCKTLSVSLLGQDIRNIEGTYNPAEEADITGAVLETFKYTQKSTDLLKMPTAIFADYIAGISNKRTISYGGIIKEYRAKLELPEEDEAEELEPLKVCRNCGNKELTEAVYQWSFADRSYLLNPNAT